MTATQAATATEPRRIKLSGPQFDIFQSQKPRNLFHGGQGSGKTFLMGIISYNLLAQMPNMLGLIAANTHNQLSDSTMKEVFSVWKSLGWTEWTTSNPTGNYVKNKIPPAHFKPHGHTFVNNERKVFLENGAVVVMASLDNYEVLEGQNLGWALLDETSDTKEAAITEVITGRLRQPGMYVNTGANKATNPFVNAASMTAGAEINPLYIFTKPAKEQWLTEYFQLESYREEILSCIYTKDDYFYKEDGLFCIVCCSAYHNAHNMTANFIENRIATMSPDIADLLVFGSPFGKSGVEYYSSFSHATHVQPTRHDPTLPLHITFDFNVNPYMTLLVVQLAKVGNRNKARVIEEICLESPKNTIEQVCRTFLGRYEHACGPGVFFYGDASGKNSVPLEDVKNFYHIVERELRKVLDSRSKRMLRQNPRHRSLADGTLGRREFMAAFLLGAHGVDLEVDPSCKKTIADFEFIKEDKNGAKVKEKAEINGIKGCEKYGHTSDAMDGLVCYLYGEFAKDRAS